MTRLARFIARLTRSRQSGLTGTAVVEAVEAILDRQHRIERESYDDKVGLAAVFAARRVLAALPVGASGDDQLRQIVAAFERLKKRQASNAGEFATGAATIGSILSDIERAFPQTRRFR
ncbi:hypothetical protein [Amorphus sp. 3PC139-8]|uniref:hypothetical protein n=1 Tax=Amorphus sp. 3PC139-8 TaxID=2735676 RepID=UPI00345D3F5A